MTVVHPQTRELTIGSLFAGYGGLSRAVEQVFGGEVRWFSEYEPPTKQRPNPSQAAAHIFAEHWPGVPNLGDVTKVDWSQVEPVDVIDGGSPCQDVSSAGRRAGMRAGTRSGLWASMCDAIDTLRPRFVVWENVRGALSAEADSAVEQREGLLGVGRRGPYLRALGRVLGDLADLGFDARWCGLRAADVGAPHARFRVFVLAVDSHAAELGRRTERRDDWVRAAGLEPSATADTADGGHAALMAGRNEPRQPEPARDQLPIADAANLGHERRGAAWGRRPGLADRGVATTHPTSDGWDEGRTEPEGIVRGSDAAERGATAADAGCGGLARLEAEHRTEPALRLPDAERPGLQRGTATDTCRLEVGLEPLSEPRSGDQAEPGHAVQWGRYEAAVRRWERCLGRPAPAPTEPNTRGGQRLSPRFVEFLMGLPDGWVCDVPGISRNDKLKALGNGVVPQQAEAALRLLLAAEARERAA